MGGLFSKQLLEDNGVWPPPEPGGNNLSHSLDYDNGNWDKVSLNFTPHTPMAYYKKPTSHLCFFAVGSSVAGRSGVIFTNTNATRSGHERNKGIEGLELVDFGAVRARPRPWDQDGWVRPVQAEILVPDRIVLNQVREVGFVSQASLEEARRIWGPTSSPNFVCRPKYFSDQRDHISINFSYLKELVLTCDMIDESSVTYPRNPRLKFARSRCEWITAIAHLQATTGVNGRMKWGPKSISSQTEFPSLSSNWWHWDKIRTQDLPDGQCTVEYRLDGIRWATLYFEVYP